MDISGLIDSLRRDLIRAAEVGGEDARAAAERVLLALDPALRLTLMDALSQAAAEISEAASGIAVEVRLSGREPVFVVQGPTGAAGADEPLADDGEAVARITLRLPEAVKERAEAVAARRGQSLNTWLVAAVRAAAAGEAHTPGPRRHGMPGRRIQGWAR